MSLWFWVASVIKNRGFLNLFGLRFGTSISKKCCLCHFLISLCYENEKRETSPENNYTINVIFALDNFIYLSECIYLYTVVFAIVFARLERYKRFESLLVLGSLFSVSEWFQALRGLLFLNPFFVIVSFLFLGLVCH